MKQVTKDGDYIIVKMPNADLYSMLRFMAHAIEKNQDQVLKLAQEIVRGDLTKQDEFVKQLSEVLDVADWSLVFDKQSGLDLCDDLADVLYDQMPIFMQTEPVKPERHLRVVKVCVKCQKGFFKGSFHDCEQI